MGRILYGPQERQIEIEDRALTHVQLVIVAKLRRNESFTFSWAAPDDGTRATVWVHPSIPLQFQFDSIPTPSMNNRWLQDLNAGAARGDLRIGDEPDPDPSRSR
ncbi:hypothetical protein GCM10010988_22350 [Cnuibacter physcomitrellae]|uniref:DUF7882 domain-containing protein n=1 Tax=Cnuibacter physcomitrellae TaxID=1619308 RepID=A0A1X9LNZ6_9MICO|nr:hypothetical protein [Cnuibacter physcomitrellae]ARJ06903.1 hypothetical protein B5808_17975 [Cnuibacter physcomitrellae]GGI39094.1 hypothetical protein GCM10010988_22350 [Cnuibacter physcomitrellae]